MQNWPTPRVIEPASPVPISVPRSAAALGGDDQRVGGTELAEEGDWHAARVRPLPQGQTRADRAGEADGAHVRRVDQRRAGVESEDQVERCPSRCVTSSRAALERRERGGAGRRVGGVGLDHDGTSGRRARTPCRHPGTEKAKGKFELPKTATTPSGTRTRRRSGNGPIGESVA